MPVDPDNSGEDREVHDLIDIDVDGDREDAVSQAISCDEVYDQFQKKLASLKVHRAFSGTLMKHLADLRTHTSCVRARHPAGFKWHTLYSSLGFETILKHIVSHRDAMIAAKATDFLNMVADWVTVVVYGMLR